MRFLAILALMLSAVAIGAAIAAEQVGVLPEPVTNNAVAALEREDDLILYSFAGLGAGKTWADTHARAFAFNLDTGESRQLPDVPGGVGRLASVAASVDGSIYFFGGYTVAEDGAEVSTPETFRFNPETETYELRAPMPVPTDDAVALVYADRYIYLISGWHNSGNINLTQLYDTVTDTWQQATPFPGAPVFGHAGGIGGREFVIAGGVMIDHAEDGTRDFVMSPEYWRGSISETDPARIRWRHLTPPPHLPRYRMAATGDTEHNRIIFLGGSSNPYNYDGIGYDGVPSKPVAPVLSYNLITNEWRTLGDSSPATMDHRGLIAARGGFYTIGGMTAGQAVTAAVARHEFD